MGRSHHENEARAGFPSRHGRSTVRVIEHAFGGRFGVAIGARYGDIVQAATDVLARHGYHQASVREIARAAGLSLGGLYHYVGDKDELLFLVIDRSLDQLIGELDRACAEAGSPEERLFALVRTHLDFGFRQAAALKIINRDHELVRGPRQAEVAAKRQAYVERALRILQELDARQRSGDELLSATNLLLGMLNGIARRPFLKSSDDTRALAGRVGALFLNGFLEHAGAGAAPASISGGAHER